MYLCLERLAISAENGYIGPKICIYCNFASGHARHLSLVSNPRFLGMENNLGSFSGASD